MIPEKRFRLTAMSALPPNPWPSLVVLSAAVAMREAWDSSEAMYSVSPARALAFSPLHHQYL